MTNTNQNNSKPALLAAVTARVFELVTECDGFARETSDALAWVTTDVLVYVAGVAADAIVRDRYRRPVPRIVRPTWLENNAILDESHVRAQAVSVLCGWAHDRNMSVFAARHELANAIDELGSVL